MTIVKTFILSVIIPICTIASAQEGGLARSIAGIVTELTEEGGSENAEMLTELLLDLAASPVFINSGDPDEISRLFFLSPFQAGELVAYIKRTGPVVSVFELALIKGFSRETAELMLPFITLEIPGTAPAPSSGSRLRFRLVTTSALKTSDRTPDPSRYPFKTSLRYRISTRNITAALTAASDAGEKPLAGGTPDFVSGGVAASGNGFLSNIIIGDYSARFGMGLTINSGYKPLLTFSGSSWMGHRDGFSLSASVNENNYLRGAAVTAIAGKTTFSGFISSRQRDARLKTDEDGSTYADILANAPVRSTLSGITAKGLLNETTTGASAGFSAGQFRGALNLCYTSFSREVREGDDTPDHLHSFRGTSSFNAGASYRMAFRRVSGAGEIAVSGSGGFATAHTINVRFDDRLTANIIYRKYSPAYYGHLARGPGRNSSTCNEEGLMMRITFEAARGLFIYAGTDIYKFPWLKSGVSFPSCGLRNEIRALYDAGKPFYGQLRITSGVTEKNSSGNLGIPAPATDKNITTRLQLGLKPASELDISTTLIYRINDDGLSGSMMSGDIGYAPASIPVSLWFRHAIYTTDGFDTALYLYENDILYGFSAPAHHGEGSRTALMLKISLLNNTHIRLKYGFTRTASGNGESRQGELKGQIVMNF